MASEDIFNFIRIDENSLTAGQPSEDQLADLAKEGCDLILNLATIDPQYSLDDEEESCRSLGMTYLHIPVEWTAPKMEDYQAFKAAMEQAAGQKILVHCAANYRATAFYAVYAEQSLGWSNERADALIARIWESNPDWLMDDVWKEYIGVIRRKG
ncbi:MAG: hypothetical protein CMQ20_12950 [Gammaproteobacteria bacterium]|jgi:protein tyrosine phosphatase (PTP) superfamily phosphohydrolase (DUF442 family)|nr:hypothetical protein [Gammaproteobacteria bacterium]|tara:strand:- start:1596 stop:2060 length:465 start_codon:yes stop_codon:yes gene_type:complete